MFQKKDEKKEEVKYEEKVLENETVTQQDLVPAPFGVDVEGWREAEHATRGRVGNYAGIPKDQRYTLVWDTYNQLVENNKQAAKWEGK